MSVLRQIKQMYPETVIESDAPAAALSISLPARVRPHHWIYFVVSAYALLVALTIHFHEPWADEAQAWLLGRDASLTALWGQLLHYEGQPGLWQTLVHLLTHLGLPYGLYGYVSGFLGLSASYLLVRYAPLPVFIRLLLPFTYYLCYQYAVIARSYALIPPLLFAIAIIFRRALEKPATVTFLLCLLAGVSVHGFLISASIWATIYAPVVLQWTQLDPLKRRKLVVASAVYWLVLLFFAACAWPAKDVAFAQHRGLANLHFFAEVTKSTFAGAFTGYRFLSFALIAISLPFLWRGGGWLFFLLASSAICLFGTIVYMQVWHLGLLFLAWLFAIWISAYKTKVTIPTLAALVVAIGFQCYWTSVAIYHDWTSSYSGSRAAVQYLREQRLPSSGIYAIGYSATALQPYFPANIYSNFHGGAKTAYWDWSERNTANDPRALFASRRRDLVLVGYKQLSEKQQWQRLLTLLGYQQTRHFGGSLFWQTGALESESFDFYRTGDGVGGSRAVSKLNTGDRARAGQLLEGFYGIEGNGWRWTAKNFSVLLKVPPGSARNGAELALRLYLPDAQVRKSGSMTLRADVGGHELLARTFSKPDEYTYAVHVPSAALQSDFIAVDFRLDKAALGLNGDPRELGLVVSSVELDSAAQPTLVSAR
jgi:hypothetical protein